MTAPSSPSGIQSTKAAQLWVTAMPGIFVLLWSTGFIGAKFGLPYAEPFTFLLWRFAILTLLLGAVAVLMKAPWPSPKEAGHTALIGLLVHGAYLGGVFAAISYGIPAGVAALIVGTQPILTALGAGPLLGERVTGRQWLGLLLGLGGVVLVCARKLNFESTDLYGITACLIALVGITFGTLYQKRHGGTMDLRSGSAIQFAASALFMAVLATTTETMQVQWTGEFIFALAWLVVVLSVGAISLLFILIKRGAASKVASLFYLVPPVTAVVAFFLFDETLGGLALAGMGLAVVGVALVVGKQK